MTAQPRSGQSIEDAMGDQIDGLNKALLRLEAAGDKLASAVETRWSGEGRCDCECCAAARDWRKTRNA